MGYLSRGIDRVHLVLMSGRSVPNEWKWLEFYDKARTMVTGETYCSGVKQGK